MNNYEPQTWVDQNATYPLSAARMNYIEAGIAGLVTATNFGVAGTGMVPLTTHTSSYGLGSSTVYITDGGRHTRLHHSAISGFSAVRLVYGNYEMQNSQPVEEPTGNNIIVKASLEMGTGSNGAFKYVSSSTAYASGTTYAVGDVVTVSSITYQSLVAGNVGNTPSTSPTSWQPVVYYPARWNGAATVTIPSGGVAISDPIYLQPGPTAQQAIYSNTLVQPNNGTANTGNYPAGPYGSTSSTTPGDWVKKSTTGSAPADYTATAPTTDVSDGFSSTNPGYGPMAIIGYPTNGSVPVIICSGDSYLQGANETAPYLFTNDTPAGWVGRLLCDNQTTPTKVVFPHFIDSKSNARDLWNSGTARAARSVVWAAGTILLDEMGINDIGGNPTLASLQALKLAKWNLAAAMGMKIAVVITPVETTSTDSWATTTNQTPKSGFTTGGLYFTYKAWLLTFPHPAIFAVIDTGTAVCETDIGSGNLVWNPTYSDGSTGIHPGTAGHIQIATAANVYYATAPSTPVTITQSGLLGSPVLV